MKLFTKQTATLALAAGMGFAAVSSAWSAESLQDVMKRRGLSQQDLLAASKTYVRPASAMTRRLQFGWPVWPGDRVRRSVHAYPEIHRRVYAGTWQGYGFDESSKKCWLKAVLTARTSLG